MKAIKIILVDDHEILMDGVAALLNDLPGLEVVAKAANVGDAMDHIKQLAPDIVITDISMGAEGGLELTKKLSAEFPLVRVIVLSMHNNASHIQALMEAGARSYLLKSVRGPELLKAIETVMKGGEYIQQELVGKYMSHGQGPKSIEQLLSPREVEIIRLIAKEMTTLEISDHLFISQFTVETHRKNILRKTGSKSVIGLLNYARKHDLI